MRKIMLAVVGTLLGMLPCSAAETNTVETVYAVVCGHPLKTGDVKSAVLIKAKIREFRRKPVPAKQFNSWANHVAAKTIPELVQRELFLKGLDDRKVVATPEATKDILSRYNALLRLKAKTLEELAAPFGKLSPEFRRQLDFETRAEAFYRQSPKTVITPRMITNEVKRIASLRARSVAANEQAEKKAKAAYDRLKAGEDWVKVAEDVSEDDLIDEENGEHFHREWETLPLKEFPEEIATAIAGLKPGEFTKPIETADGLMIVKFVQKADEGYTCVRIGFRLAIVPEIPSEEVVRKKLRKESTVELQRGLIDSVRAANPVVYPMGKKFAVKIWDLPNRKMKSPLGSVLKSKAKP